MKKSILISAAAALTLQIAAQGKYTINGNLQNAEGQKIYLSVGDFGNTEIDSTVVANGKFTFQGELQEPYRKQYQEFTKNYIQTHTDSYYATQYLSMDMGSMTYEDIKAAWDKLSPDVQKYGVNAKAIKSELEVLAKVRPGKPAPDFTANDINGKPFTLSSLKGKVVILDFWASWCVPCRKSNPHMRELYAKYHKKGLDMVYVSDNDSNPAKWKAAVEKDQLVGDGFHHVLRGLKITDRARYTFDKTNDISDKYAIHFLPTKYLIDKKGNIVCKINEGEDAKLDAEIERLLNSK